jgi:D-glycero-D-manno-heptose 1,7-bisphosphate phosphatase
MERRLAKKGLVVLDRDGVVNRDSKDFVKSAGEWVPLPGSIEAIAGLSRAGFTVAVASNQSGLGRGLFDRRALAGMHRKFRRLVATAGGRVDRIVVCPHTPEDGCDCRKPRAGLLHRLGRYYKTDLGGVPVVGDSLRDLEAAVTAGARPILVRTGNGQKTEAALKRAPGAAFRSVRVFDDLAAAAAALVEE